MSAINEMNNKITHLLQIGKTLAVIACALIGLAYGAPAAATEMAGGAAIDFQNGSGPMFDFTGFMPGDRASSWIRTQNLGTSQKDITVWVENAVNTEKLGDQMQITISKDSSVLYQKSLTDFFSGGHVHLSTLGAFEAAAYDFVIDFDFLAGNEYQGTALSFDLAVNASENGNGIIIGDDDTGDDDAPADDDSDDASDDTDDDTPVKRHSSGSIGGGGFVSELIITNVRAEDITDHSASIKWDTNLNATSQVIYSPAHSGHLFDPAGSPLYGYFFIYPVPEDRSSVSNHTVPLTSLAACQAYYYRVISRAQMPLPSISEEYWFKTPCPQSNPPVGGSSGSVVSSRRGEVLGIETGAGGDDVIQDQPSNGTASSDKDKALSPLVPGSLWDALGGIAGILGFQTCSPNFPWWLFLLFAIYPALKSRQRFKEAKATINPTLKKFFTASARAWRYSLILPLGLALWAFLTHHCLPWWPLVVLLIATLIAREYDRRKAAATKNPPMSGNPQTS